MSSVVRTIAVWASVSCVASLVVLVPGRLQATDPEPALTRPAVEIAQPVFSGDGFDLRVRLVGQASDQPVQTLKAGEALRLELVAVNKTDQRVTVKSLVRVTTAAPTSPMSRTLPIPTEAYKDEPTITLAPHETKTITLAKMIDMPERSVVTVSVGDAGRAIAALRVENPPAATDANGAVSLRRAR
jgi:hypothetical protein